MEIWLPVIDFEGIYDVSNQGRVKSLEREILCTSPKGVEYLRHIGERILSPQKMTGGHLHVPLSRNNSTRRIAVSHLVLEAFVCRRPAGLMALHWDDDKTNNWVGNLRWGTQSENLHDTVRNGNHHNVHKTHCPRRHEYTPENTYMTKSGSRTCRACYREKAKERYHLKKQAG